MSIKHSQILFIHIQKTAGSSVKSLLSTRFDLTDILEISEGKVHWAQGVAQVDAYRLAIGHVGFGFANAFQRRPAVITFLRDPIERAVSYYYFLRQFEDSYYADDQPAERQRREYAVRRARELSLLEFIRSEPDTAAVHLGNLQTWYLSSREFQLRPYRELVADDLYRAQANLAQCECVGLAERFDDSMAMLCHTLQWEPFAGLPHVNKTICRPAVNDLDQETIDALRQLTQLDEELYRFATLLFEQRWRALLAAPRARQACDPLDTSFSVPPGEAGDSTVFTFDRAIPGNGWYGREQIGTRWCSWIGPSCEAWITLAPLPREGAVLRVHIVHALKPEILHGTQLLINGTALAVQVRRTDAGHVLEASVPTSLSAASGRTARIMIRVPEVLRPCNLEPFQPDSRLLSIAVDSIVLVPDMGNRQAAWSEGKERVMILTDEQWIDYSRNGFLHLGKVLEPEEVKVLQQRADDLALGNVRNPAVEMQLDTGGEYEKLPGSVPSFDRGTILYRKIQGLESDHLFSLLVRHPLFLEICARQYGRHAAISIFRAIVMNKPAGQGTVLPWHQDGGDIWALDRDPQVTIWVALDPATQANGCVEVIPGTHRLGLLSSFGSSLKQEDMVRHCPPDRVRPLEVEAGHAVLLHNWLIHRSGVNPSPMPRRAFSVCYMDGRTQSILTGNHFPVVAGSLPVEPYPYIRQLRNDCAALRQTFARAEEYAKSLQQENQTLHQMRAEAERYAKSLEVERRVRLAS